MPDILYGKGSYRRDNGQFPELKLINMFPEAAPTVENGVAILSRPGLAVNAVRGAGPVHAIYQRPGLFAGDVFTLSNNTLYRGSTSLGTINGSGPPSITSSDNELVITRGQTAYSYNGTNLAAITFPDAANVTAVAYLGGLFFFARADTYASRIYFSAIKDARTIAALSYTSADSSPDAIRDLVAVGDNLFVLGEVSLEVFYLTTSATAPLSRISQRTRNRGVVDRGCAVEFDNALHFIGEDHVVYRMAEVPQRMSNHGLEERIAASTSWKMFSFLYQGHAFLCIRVDDGTWVFDPAGGSEWPEFQTHGQSNFIAQCAVTTEDGVLFGSAIDGSIYEFSDDWMDVGSALVRRFTGAFPIKGGAVPVDMLELECNAGAILGDTNPQIEMRSSRDGGNTFGMYRTASLGAQGERRKRPRWRRLGFFDAPGGVFDFRVTDATPLRVSAVLINEPASGRSR